MFVIVLFLRLVISAFSQRAAPEMSSCVTAVDVCCLCQCVMANPTAKTKQTRETAAINTKVQRR